MRIRHNVLGVVAVMFVVLATGGCRMHKPSSNTETPSALPAGEIPLHSFGMSVHDNAVIIYGIVNGRPKAIYIDSVNIQFELRSDGWKHVSARPIEKSRYADDNYAAAVVLVPDAECLERWKTWFARELKRAQETATEAPGRDYPSRVLPPE